MQPASCILSFTAVFVLISSVSADEKASTLDLPIALETLGAGTGDIVSSHDAARVRGSGMPSNWPMRQYLGQSSSGNSPSSIVIVNGIIGSFYYRDVHGFETEGVFGGQSGFFRTVPGGGIEFGFQGKAVRTEVFFHGPVATSFQ